MANSKAQTKQNSPADQPPLDPLDEVYDYADPAYNDPFGLMGEQDVEVTLFSWYGPSHVKRRASKRYYFNLGLLALIIALILIFLQQFYLLMMVLAIVFLLIVMTIADPKPIRHVITNYGIYSGNNFYPWEKRGKCFWLETDGDQRVLIVQIKKFPYQVVMLLNPQVNEADLIDLLSNFLVFEQPKPNWVDKVIIWWKKTFPLD